MANSRKSVSVDQGDLVRQATNATSEGSISKNWMRPVYGGRHDMNRPAPKTLRRRFFVVLGHAIHVTWPVLSAILAVQLALGLLAGFVEGWSLGDAVYFTFITGLTIGYGDLVPTQALTRALAIGIGFFGLFVTALIAAIAVHAMRSSLTDDGSGNE